MMLRRAFLGAAVATLGAYSAAATDEDGAKVDFNRDVRPILSEACFQCHGPDQGHREADLRLDQKEGLLADRGGYAAVVPGKPDDSELMTRITSTDDDQRMPPPDSGHKLTPEQIERIRLWIEQGAEWKGHWAYEPPARPAVPDAEDAAFVRNDIDRFVLARLRDQQLAPSSPADRVTLIRRLSFDLTGLPPAPEEVEAFIADERPDACERLVERLLASPRFGERMALHWLDVVRYADTEGFHGDNHRDVWLYRNYVIRAFNLNKPYDRFLTEQLAGDLLPKPTVETRIASGFNRLQQITREGGAQPKEYVARYAGDRVRNTSVALLGATVGCAECHDHKFDPITQKDFYAFSAFFADLQEVPVGQQAQTRFPSREQRAEFARIDAQIAATLRELEQPGWTTLVPETATSENGTTLTVEADGTIVAAGESPQADVYTLTIPQQREGLTGLRLTVLPDEGLPGGGPGRAIDGGFFLNEIEATAGDRAVEFSASSDTFAEEGWDASYAIDGVPRTGWQIRPRTSREHHAVFELKEDMGGEGAATLTVRLHFLLGDHHTLGRFRLEGITAARPVRTHIPAPSPEIQAILDVDAGARTAEQQQTLRDHYAKADDATVALRQELDELRTRRARLEASVPSTLVSIAGPLRTTRLLPRGNWMDESGEVVEPAAPAFLGSVDVNGRATRLDLARWVTSRENPLTARVFVNRLWAQLFGQGIVTSLDDFGAQGTWPTHPDLLDWLAVEFMESGWDVKHMVRLMVHSGTYGQSSDASPELLKADPYNKWLARQGRFRLPAEMIRDNALAVSGLLAPRLGGPSVKPYQPAGYWMHLNFPKREWVHDTGPDQYRRGVYTYWCRTFPHPSLTAFDAPTREECTVDRPRSNTPTQALTLLNDPTYVEAARTLAERVLRDGGDTLEERVRFACRAVLSRDPHPEEADLIAALAEKHLGEYRSDAAAAEQLLANGLHPPAEGLDRAELAAWTSVARVILNLHEAITRQ